MKGTVFLLFFVMAACTSVLAGSVVGSSVDAIRIAETRCYWTPASGRFEKWYAVLHQGVWHVWLSLEPGTQEEPESQTDPDYDFLDLRIRASDGRDSGCSLAVG